jgi:hypothetical protein
MLAIHPRIPPLIIHRINFISRDTVGESISRLRGRGFLCKLL